MKRSSNNPQEGRVFHLTFTSGKTQHRVSVASTNKEEAKALVLAVFDNVKDLKERSAACS